ncbi:putative sulfate exporter family transporter [Flammeovirga yaeyamensis]|uniref:Sulfate exporter family transporter n=1 Tax=Flammeovirga yaeyamensis TaxID=367791 RepID=A0AAX1N601_9BACT|nr:putative sulfate exporter family transporter [Flammeovirga yaeyamensis]MBB3697592.1 putative integral membrane protein (TIGR00698 family) [Flammeovirga yaeyamensis]NMF36282.1 putative sulfate exporter family transporter [Flammeovirga yaeyamensis]QWG03009.1 putative sulfate exporter family transporter [Flammeovirga yaeyamensis]
MKKIISTINQNPLINKVTYTALAIITLLPFTNSVFALFSGILFAIFFKIPHQELNKKISSNLLKWSVVFLGFGLNAKEAIETGSEGSLITFTSIALTLSFGAIIGKKLGLDKTIYRLIASGTAICGGSAIAAMAPALKADEKQISVAMGTVFILNAVALVVFPIVGHIMDLTQTQFGWWAALAIHDTSAVIGAGQAFGEEALKVATTVKLTRALWIVPISLIAAVSSSGKLKLSTMPIFIFGFIGAVILNTFVPAIHEFAPVFNFIAHKGLALALFAIGCTLDVQSIKKVGIRPIFQGLTLWSVISVVSLIAVIHLF